MDLVIAEKDEVAKDIARAVCGCTGDVRLPASGNGYVVCACSGHLLESVEPGEVDERYADRSDVSALPIVMREGWPVEPRDGRAAKRVSAIRDELGRCDTVYCAGDADDEGQLIVDEVLRYCGCDPRAPRFRRVVVNDNLPGNIRRAFEASMPNADLFPNGQAALARSLADFSFGVSESRLASDRVGRFVSIGRVQTPTLGLVVRRDRLREGHVERAYYDVVALVSVPGVPDPAPFKLKPGPALAPEDGKRVYDRALAEAAAAAVDGERVSFEVSVASKVENPPLPFNMVELARNMSRTAKMTAADVMEATQVLRDRYKAITYNRTDSRYLKSEHFDQARELAPLVLSNLGARGSVDTSRRGPAFDDSKCPVHHAIIPQMTGLDSRSLPLRESLVYEAVAKRYLLQFAPPRLYEVASASFGVPGVDGEWRYRAERDTDPGFRGPWGVAFPVRR